MGLLIDGEVLADAAVVDAALTERFPFIRLGKSANVMIFADLISGVSPASCLINWAGPAADGFGNSVRRKEGI
jgi:phosphotransacetylase